MTDITTGELFTGFDIPKQNYTNLPVQFIEALPLFKTLAEMKVVIYVLRHTWGYQEYSEGKRITLDEFEHGRKKRDGSRLDNGIGMVKNSINDGIDNAVKHGFLCVESDESDPARIKRYYSLRMFKDCTPEGQTLTPGVPDIDPRTEITTLDTNLKKENVLPDVAKATPAVADPTPQEVVQPLQEKASTKSPPVPPPPSFLPDTQTAQPGEKPSVSAAKSGTKERTKRAPAPRKPWSDLTDAMHEAIPENIRPPGKPYYAKYNAPAKALYDEGFTPERVKAYVQWAYQNDKWFRGGGDGGQSIVMTMHAVKEKIKAFESGGKINGSSTERQILVGPYADTGGFKPTRIPGR